MVGIRGIILVCFVFLLKDFAFAQEEEPEEDIRIKNTIYLELGGNGLAYSLNYERIFREKGNHLLSVRFGASYWTYFINDLSDEIVVAVPLEFNYLLGKGDNYLNLGIGITPAISNVGLYDYWFVPRVGYRFQKQDGQFISVGLTPLVWPKLVPAEQYFLPWASIQLGISF